MALANIALTDTFNTWIVRTNQIIVSLNTTNAMATTIGVQANLAYNQANTANTVAVATGVGANAYAVIVGNAGNTYTAAVGIAGNNYTNSVMVTVGAGANSYASSLSAGIGTGANNYTNSQLAGVGTGANNYTNSQLAGVGTGANNYTNSQLAGVGAGANNYAATIGAASNTYAASVGAASNTIATNAFAKANGSVQNNTTTLITTGYTVQSFNAGANLASYGTWTPNPANGNYQYANTNGALTIAVPPADCAIDVLLTNGPTTGAISFAAGYTVQTNGTGDSYVTTSGYKFIISFRRIYGISSYMIKALQ